MARGYFDRWHSSGRWIAFAALHPHYLIAFDLVNSSCTPSADGSAITGGSAVTFFTCFLFYFSRSARLTAGSGFTLHQYYFIEVDLVNCFCTTPVLFHWQPGSSRSTLHCASSFFMEFGQHLFTSFQNYMGQQGQQDSPRRRMWEEHQFHGLLPASQRLSQKPPELIMARG